MQDNSALGRAITMVGDLRNRCSWDRVQTRDTLRPYLVEEVHELDHALAIGDPTAIRHEVADLLLHLAWQLVLGEELGEFTQGDVADDLEAKMKRRHPHLFDLGPKEEWELLKKRERPGGALSGLPPSIVTAADPGCQPSARSIRSRVRTVGVVWSSLSRTLARVLGLGKPRRAACCLDSCSCANLASTKSISRETPAGAVMFRTIPQCMQEVGT